MLSKDQLSILSGFSPTLRRQAEVRALVDGPLDPGDFQTVIQADAKASGDAQYWSIGRIRDGLNQLARAGVLRPAGTIHPAWREGLVLQVLRAPHAAARLAAVRAAAPRSHREGRPAQYWRAPAITADVSLARSVRLAALTDDGESVERLISLAEKEMEGAGLNIAMGALLLRGFPADIEVIDALTPALRDRVAGALVEGFLDHAMASAGLGQVIDVLRTRERDWAAAPRLDLALMRLDLLGERPKSARSRIARLADFDPAAAMAGEAALAFLAGPPADSLPRFRAALKLHRKLSGKRRAPLPREFCIYHLLALFAAGDATALREISVLLPVIHDFRPLFAGACEILLGMIGGRDDLARPSSVWLERAVRGDRGDEGPLELAATTLVLALIDGASCAPRENDDAASMRVWGASAPLCVRMIAEAHARASKGGNVWRDLLAALGGGHGRVFIDIVPVRPAWDRALDRLQAFLTTAPASAGPAPNKARRLVFRLDPVLGEIEALEQTARREGWSPGRAVSLQRLFKRDAKLDYLTDEDARVLNTIRKLNGYQNGYYYDDHYEFDAVRGPLALVGHPRVFDAAAPERRIEVIAYPAELVVREEGERILIDLTHRAESPCVFIDVESPDRWRVVEVTAALVELGRVLGPRGLEAPKAARERVVTLVTTENPRLPVRSELAGVAGQDVDGEVAPVLQIAPEAGGFVIRALVRPLGEQGPALTPGLGARSLLVPVAGRHLRARRDLAAETAALEAVAAACPALTSWRESDHLWRISETDAALETLQQLHDYEGPLVLEWPQGAAIRPTRTADAKSVSLNISSGKDWFEVKGRIQVDENLVLDMAEVVSRLGASHGRFVALDDGRYLALTEDLRRRLDAFAAVTEPAKGGQRVATAAAEAIGDLVEAVGTVKADARWADMVERRASAQGYEPALPPGLLADLRDYQMQGFVWLARLSRLGLGACLADDMGLGKTVQTLALLLTDRARGPSLVVAPTSVCHNWVLEAARFAPDLKVTTLAGAVDRAALVAGLGSGDLLVVSYGLLHTESELLASRRFAVAVFDEAQNLKNADTRRAQASKRIEADFRLALSGTPVENRLDELWSLFDTVTPGLLGSRERFQKRFAGPIEQGQAGPRQALRTLLRPYLLRRTKAAVLAELPSRTEIALEVEPGPEERAFYEALRRRALDTLARSQSGNGQGAGGQKRIRILAEIMRLRRAACNPALIDPGAGVESAKLAALLTLAAELKAGRHRALVFSQFTGHLDLAQAALNEAGLHLLRLDGSTPTRERARLVAAFQAGEGDLFLISLKAGGSGLNLTGADYVIHLDPWWNPAVEDQATDRAHRIGQTLPVTVYRLVLKDSIEEQILSLHAAKRALSADFLNGAEGAGALDEDELMALIRG